MPYSVYGVDPILISQAAQQAQAGTTPKSGNVITTISSAISGIAVPLLTALFPGGIKGNGSITLRTVPFRTTLTNTAATAAAAYWIIYRCWPWLPWLPTSYFFGRKNESVTK
ncbi:hypothetical protein [Salmonirosea aquatica]|uniref:Uncharacterized protein n=1 Tax=Salmonirosea aquatica TaxID=2654236 RepID=A0A7C9BM67_9BACT|nr:hypothetical protein [Cytophagaceae bacterium SJW1-29]